MPKLSFSSDEESEYYHSPSPAPQIPPPIPPPPPPPPPAPALQEIDISRLGGKYAISPSPSVKYESPGPLAQESAPWPYGERDFVVLVPEVVDRDSYTVCEAEPSEPRTILSKFTEDGVKFEVDFGDGDVRLISEFELLSYDGGMNLILEYDGDSYDTTEVATPVSSNNDTERPIEFEEDVGIDADDEDQAFTTRPTHKNLSQPSSTETRDSTPSVIALEEIPVDFNPRKRARERSKKKNHGKILGLDMNKMPPVELSDDDDENSDERGRRKLRRTRTSISYARESEMKPLPPPNHDKFKKRWKSLMFVEYPPESKFATFHMDCCFKCGRSVDARLGTVALCQCCSRVFHPKCLHDESSVFRIGGKHYLQCTYCLNVHRQISNPMGPRYDVCTYCNETSPAAVRYRNAGGGLVNPAPPWLDCADLLFRCGTCDRGFHYYHLPPPDANNLDESEFDLSDEALSIKRLSEYTKFNNKWNCYDCAQAKDANMKVERLIAWKPVGPFSTETDIMKVPEDHRMYAVKYAYTSYAHLEWRPGHWIYSEKILPKNARMDYILQYATSEEPAAELDEVVPPGYLEMDVILDAKIGREPFSADGYEDALSKIELVTSVYVKMKGLDYDDIVWEAPPKPNDNLLYPFFKSAFEEYVKGLFTIPPPDVRLNLTEARNAARANLAVTPIREQPPYIQSIKLLSFQLTGLNWLYKNWVSDTSCTLADEPGMGKAIQVVSFFAVIIEKHNIWPHLIITTPHGVLDWRRKFARIAPSVRVITYSGSTRNRIPIREHGLYHPDGRMKCHVVITDYDTVSDDGFLRAIDWHSVVADEGHTVVYDETRSANTIDKFRSSFRIVLTGMPITSNHLRLRNIIKYLEGKGASRKEGITFPDVSRETKASFDMFRGVRVLRRTKNSVIKPLQTASEYILPVNLTALQRSQYRKIVRVNAEIVGPAVERKEQHKSRVNGVLRQIREVLAHPYVFDEESQGYGDDLQQVFDAFLAASQKYQVLALLLPKLKELGNRAVIFTQTSANLDCLEYLLLELNLKHLRLDKHTAALDRQACVDEFNSADSDIFAIISTSRDGGVGLNLPTADTVIILDADYDSNRDYNAIARAHRIGQARKVRIFTLMTVDTAEERLLDISLNGVVDAVKLSDSIDIEDKHDAGICGPEYLAFGLKAIFETNGPENPEHYTAQSVSEFLEKALMNPFGPLETSASEHAVVLQNGAFENFTKVCRIRPSQEKIKDAIWTPILQNRLQNILFQGQPELLGDSDTEDERDPILKEPAAGTPIVECVLCGKEHPVGFCPPRLVKVEICPLCDTAHLAGLTNCLAMRNPNDIKAMIQALHEAPDDPNTIQDLVDILEKRKIQLLAMGEWWVDGKGGWVEKDKAVAVRGR